MYLESFGHYGLRLFYFSILAMFLVGLWAVKSGYLRRVIADAKTTRRLLVVALTAATVGYAWPSISSRVLPAFLLSGAAAPSDA